MLNATEGRIPILFGVEPEPGDALLLEGDHETPASFYALRFALVLPGHAASCVCCTWRAPVADALARMFRARATGSAPFFKRVVVQASPAGEEAVRAAASGDVMALARYRVVEGEEVK
jgi:hypothetical protein